MRRTPIIHLIAEGIRPGLYRAKDISPIAIRQAAPTAAEIRINRTDIAVIAVAIFSRSIRLPKLHQHAAQGTRIAVQHAAMDDDALTNREALLGVIQDQIIVAWAKLLGAKDRARQIGHAGLQGKRRARGAAEHAGLVDRRNRQRMLRQIALDEILLTHQAPLPHSSERGIAAMSPRSKQGMGGFFPGSFLTGAGLLWLPCA